MKKTVLIGVLLSILSSAYAQVDTKIEKVLDEQKKVIEKTNDSTSVWKVGGIANVNFSQVYLSNWAGGGQNSITTTGLLSFYAKYAKNHTSWDNTLDLAYGVIKQGNEKAAPWFKNDDRMELNSKFGHKASEKWYYSGLVNFRSQFNYGYNKVGDTIHISNFMAPGYTIIAIGMDFKPNKSLTVFIAPLTSKLTFVMDDYLSSIGAFGVDSNSTFRSEIGGYLKFAYAKEKPFNMEGVTFKTKLSLFSNYLKKPQNIDVTWETLTNIKLNKYLTLSLSTYLIYDNDIDIARYNSDGSTRYYQDGNGNNLIDSKGNFVQVKGPATQFKEAWAVGFGFKF